MILVVFATIGGFLVGGFFGFVFVNALGISKGIYHSKQECRECRARMAEHGFHVGFKCYKCVEKKD